MTTQSQRCPWANGSDKYLAYHDEEWGVPVHDDRTLFEFLILEGAQAGLSWSTILSKREIPREASADSIRRRSRASPTDRERLLGDPASCATA
jgi:DNA-3-methyladenine glycosylase I